MLLKGRKQKQKKDDDKKKVQKEKQVEKKNQKTQKIKTEQDTSVLEPQEPQEEIPKKLRPTFSIRDDKKIIFNEDGDVKILGLTVWDNIIQQGYVKVHIKDIGKLWQYNGALFLEPDGYGYNIDIIERGITILQAMMWNGTDRSIYLFLPRFRLKNQYLPAMILGGNNRVVIIPPIRN